MTGRRFNAVGLLLQAAAALAVLAGAGAGAGAGARGKNYTVLPDTDFMGAIAYTS
eukprot:COSAG06_NODE_35351_length_461_cov_0.812155_1_plen_54_part_01